MKEKWLMACNGSWDGVKPLITTALETGFNCVIVDRAHVDRVRELGGIKVAAFGATRGPEDILIVGSRRDTSAGLCLPDDLAASADIGLAKAARNAGSGTLAAYIEIRSKRDEELAVQIGKNVDYLIVVGTDWKVIPLENMIAGLQNSDVKIISGIRAAKEAKLALSTLESGADGIMLETNDPIEIKKAGEEADRADISVLRMVQGKVTAIKPVGMGDRVCVDTANLMIPGEGMLIGSQSRAFFLIQSEAEDSPYVASRPFRVNAGAVHAYIRVGEKTRYLSELKGGDEVTIVNRAGESRGAIVGRVKIEKRPMILVEAEAEGQNVSTLLQNAETIKLVSPSGSISVAELKVGDSIMMYLEGGARHFGMSIEESIIER
jgi:3-dehydroquinate synthase II